MEKSPLNRPGAGWSQRFTQQRVIDGLAATALVFHALILLIPGPYLVGIQHISAVYGLFGCAAVLVVNRREAWHAWVNGLALSIVAVWLCLDILSGVQARAGTSLWMALDTVLVTIMLYTTSSFRRAVVGSLAAYVFFVWAAVAATRPDPALIAYVGLVLAFIAYLSSHGQLVARERLRAELLHLQMQRDGLTGALTRQAFLTELNALLGGRHVILMIDLDYFKAVNDQFGHLVGDRALQHLVRVLQDNVRLQDRVYRWGGEEFLVLLDDISLTQGEELAQRLRLAVKESREPGIPPLTVSVGMASLEGITDVTELIGVVDARMYAAKSGGRDRVVTTP